MIGYNIIVILSLLNLLDQYRDSAEGVSSERVTNKVKLQGIVDLKITNNTRILQMYNFDKFHYSIIIPSPYHFFKRYSKI